MQHSPTDHADTLDPDIRFLLANERTLLAWIRTGLTLQAGGFALAHFSAATSVGRFAGILAVLAGGLFAIVGYSRFRAADRAIRSHRLPDRGTGPTLEVLVVVVIAVILAGLQIINFTK